VNDMALLRTFQTLFCLTGLLCTLATAGVGITARIRSDSWHRRHRYAVLGGVFGFLFGVSMSALMLMDNPDSRALPMMLLLSLACGLVGAFLVFYSMWSSKWWGKRLDHLMNNEPKKEDSRRV
jgi:uncharacterized membrane protein